MRTARVLSLSEGSLSGGFCPGGPCVCVWGGGGLCPGDLYPGGLCQGHPPEEILDQGSQKGSDIIQRPPPPVDRMTDLAPNLVCGQ